MAVEFKDNSVKVKNEIGSKVERLLYECGQLVQSRARDQVRVDTGDTKRHYEYVVEMGKSSGTATIGNILQNAIWEEYGTGEFALNHDGRKGGWVYNSKKDGEFYTTKGKKPTRPLYKAFSGSKKTIKNRIKNIMKEL